MGTYIHLDVGGMRVDWCKNARGADHGVLFQACDRTRARSDQINYDCGGADDPVVAGMEAAFARSLADVVPRLELLGFSLDSVESQYAHTVQKELGRAGYWGEVLATLDDDVAPETIAAFEARKEAVPPMSFGEFREFVIAHPIEELDDTPLGEGGHCFEGDPAIGRLPDPLLAGGGHSERNHFGSLLSFLHPYATLRLVAESPANLHSPVVWQYGALAHAGYAEASDFEAGPRRHQIFLIATEGSSDALILKHALALLRPNIADFFRFVDMEKGYPFTGTGNLRRFATGLAAIDVHNNVLFLLDNDAEGVDACARIGLLPLPANMRATCLPDLSEFESVACHGPNGVLRSDINRRAAAIECYLDLAAQGQPPAEFRWTNFRDGPDVYQGSLQKKDRYTRHFLNQTAKSLADGDYDPTKISRVLDHVLSVCCQIATRTNPWVESLEWGHLA